MTQPTKRQLEIHAWWLGYQHQHGRPTCFQDVMRKFNWNSKSSVACHVPGMIEKGLLKRVAGDASSRNLVAVPIGEQRCPFCGAAVEQESVP